MKPSSVSGACVDDVGRSHVPRCHVSMTAGHSLYFLCHFNCCCL